MTEEASLKQNEEREFQLEMLRIQLKYANATSLLTVFLSIVVAIYATLITVGLSGILPSTVMGTFWSIIMILTAVNGATIFIAYVLIIGMQKHDLKELYNRFSKKR